MIQMAVISYHTCPAAFQEGMEQGGMNTYVWELSNALGSSQVFIDVFTRQHDISQPLVTSINEYLRLIHLPAGPPTSLAVEATVEYIEEFLNHLYDFIRKNYLSYTMFHGHYYLSGLIAERLNQKMHQHIPLIMSFHTLELAKNEQYSISINHDRVIAEKNVTQKAAKIIANCRLDQQQLIRLYQVPLQKIEVIPPGVNTSIFKPKKKHLRTGSQLLFIGRTQKIKGLEKLLQALKLLNTIKPNFFQLRVVGSNSSYIERLVDSMGIQGHVLITSQSHPTQLAQYLQTADLLVVPSYYESYGMVALEAIACRTPVIVTKNCGVADFIAAYNKDWVMASNKPELIGNTILYLLSNPELLQFTINADSISWNSRAASMKKCYLELIH